MTNDCEHSAGVICQPATDSLCMPLVSTCPTNNITITQTKTNTCQERTLNPPIVTTTVQITNYTCTATPISTPELMYTTKYVTEYTCTAMPISTPELMYTTKYVTEYTCTATPISTPELMYTTKCVTEYTPIVMPELIRTKYVTNNCTSPTIENATPRTMSSSQQHSQSSQDSNCNTTTGYNNSIASTGGLGAFTGMLILALIGVSIGWACTCVITKRLKTGTYNIHRYINIKYS